MATSFLMLPWAIAGVLVIRVLKPFIKIRFAPINATRVGHLVLDVEMMLTEDEFRRKTNPIRVLDVWYPWVGNLGVANSYILNLWRQRLFVLPRILAGPIDSLNRMLPGGDTNIFPYRKGIPMQLGQHHDIYGARRAVQTHLEMPASDVRRAQEIAADLGILPSDKFVCLQVRDSAYLRWQTGRDWFDDPDRNSEIGDYVRAASFMLERGYKVIRMGVVAEKPFLGPWGKGEVVDLPFTDERSDLLDAYFGLHCSFFVTTGSGIDALAHAGRIPLVTTNVSDYLRDLFLTHETVSIVRIPVEASTGRVIPLKEFVDYGFHLLKPEDLSKEGISFVANSSEEIAEVVTETVGAIEMGFETFLSRSMDEELQVLFRSALPAWACAGGVRGVVSPSFLRRHVEFIS